MLFNSSILADEEERLLAAEKSCELHEVAIEECGEKLVAFPSELCYPYYHKHMGVGSNTLYLRETVATLLLGANEAAQAHGYSVVLYDGYRDNSLQEDLFLMYLSLFTAPRMGFGKRFEGVYTPGHVRLKLADLPEETRQTLTQANSRYVAIPSNDPKRPANHRTGGSADVWLYRDGQACDLGVEFDHMNEESHAFYFLNPDRKPWPTGGRDAHVAANRAALLCFMMAAGFTVYPYEIWHFDYGNQRHARIIGGSARYGSADALLPKEA